MKTRDILYIAFASATLAFASCADEESVVEDNDTPLAFTVRSEWIDGRGESTRAIPAGLKEGTPVTPAPEWLYVIAEKKDNSAAELPYFLVKPDADNKPDPDEPAGYTDYHGFFVWESNAWKSEKKMTYSRSQAKDMQFTAYYYTEDGAALTASVTSSENQVKPLDNKQLDGWDIPSIGNSDFMSSAPTYYPSTLKGVEYNGDHILFVLKHRTALLRLKFAVDSHYDQIRSIVLRSVSINTTKLKLKETTNLPVGSDPEEPGMQLTTTANIFACAYLNPTDINASTELTFECTYDIFDKDAIEADHCTRKNVTATNKVTLKNLPDPITNLEAGKYYDLTITINPDYLYVLTEHDNKMHLTVK